jgi:hypothetical protein
MSAVNVRKESNGAGKERVPWMRLGWEFNEDFEETGLVVGAVAAAELDDELPAAGEWK